MSRLMIFTLKMPILLRALGEDNILLLSRQELGPTQGTAGAGTSLSQTQARVLRVGFGPLSPPWSDGTEEGGSSLLEPLEKDTPHVTASSPPPPVPMGTQAPSAVGHPPLLSLRPLRSAQTQLHKSDCR